MKKAIVTIGTAAAVIFTSTFTAGPVTVSAERNVDTLKTEQNELNKDLTKVEKKIKEILLDIQKVHKEIVELESEIKKNENFIKEIHAEIKTYEKEIDKINERIAERSDILKSRISSFQQAGGNVNILEVILGAKSPLELISRVDAVTTMTGADQELIDEQEADLNEVEVKVADLDDMQIDLKEIQQLLENDLKEEEKAKKNITKKEKELKEEKKKIEKDLQSVNSDLAAFESEIRSTMNQTATRTETKTSNNNQNQVKNYPKGSGGGAAISRAKSVIGSPYHYAGKTPSGFDCSGFVSWAYGGSIPSSTAALSGMGTKVSTSEMKTGDLVFFDTVGRNGHVGIYLGGGKFIGSQSSTGVAIADMNSGYWKNTFKGHVRRVQ